MLLWLLSRHAILPGLQSMLNRMGKQDCDYAYA